MFRNCAATTTSRATPPRSRRRAFSALKTNTLLHDGERLASFNPGFGRTPGWPELNWDTRTLRAVADTLAAIREGVGPDFGVMLDVNFHFKTEGFRRVADAVAPFALSWLEIDTHDAESLRLIREMAPCPIASCETLCTGATSSRSSRNTRWMLRSSTCRGTGSAELVKIAAMAEPYEINVAPHNFYGHLSTMQSAHLCASVPNFRIMEIDIDGAPWRDEFFTAAPRIEDGCLVLPTAPGWGIDVNERAVRARPPK